MIRRSSKTLPVRFDFPPQEDRQEGWGRFLELGAGGARLLSRFRLGDGDSLRLDFELSGETFNGLAAQVRRAWKDEDGYFVAELRFKDEVGKKRLERVLREFLARSLY